MYCTAQTFFNDARFSSVWFSTAHKSTVQQAFAIQFTTHTIHTTDTIDMCSRNIMSHSIHIHSALVSGLGHSGWETILSFVPQFIDLCGQYNFTYKLFCSCSVCLYIWLPIVYRQKKPKPQAQVKKK